MKIFFLVAFLAVSVSPFAQYAVSDIPQELIDNSDAIVRNDKTEVILKRYNKMEVSEQRVVTVFNRSGLQAINTSFTYDSAETIKKLEAFIYDKNGKQIKKYKEKDFTDRSASGGYLYVDNRTVYLDYTPAFYPFTLEYNIEYSSTTTAVLPGFNPVIVSEVSVQKCSYTLINESGVLIKKVEKNLDLYNVQKSETANVLSYSASNIVAFENEALAPDPKNFLPRVHLSPKKFTLAGVTGDVDSWESMGLWQYENLLEGLDKLSPKIITEIENILVGVDDDKEKSKLIYEYMQNKTRYVNIAIGIGGWRPTKASMVHDLSYGDCKGLTNYTRALLGSQGISSYYTVVDSGNDGQDIDGDFVALQGNHVILTVPFDDENVFLECTSQQVPYNYLGTFTDDRQVLMVTPEGGVLIKTHTYPTEENTQELKAVATLNKDLMLSGTLEESSKGIRYGNKYGLETAKANMSISYTANSSSLIEDIAGDLYISPMLFFAQTENPFKADKREYPIFFEYPKSQKYNISLKIPDGYKVKSLPQAIKADLANNTGSYTYLLQEAPGILQLAVSLDINTPIILPQDYEYVKGMFTQITEKEKEKIVLTKI